MQFPEEVFRHQNVGAPAVDDGFILSLYVFEFRCFAVVCQAHGVEVYSPEVLTHIIVPRNVFNRELLGIVPTKCDIACFIIARKV